MSSTHVRKNWLLGTARREREEARKLPIQTVAQAMSAIKFVFEDDNLLDWGTKAFADMTETEQETARKAWRSAEDMEEASEMAAVGQDCDMAAVSNGEGADRPCHRSDYASIRARMRKYLTSDLKWMHRDLHDAFIATGIDITLRLSLIAVW